jgi:hypothetical protein
MHRSGTSAVAGTAVRLGLAPPRMLLRPTADNPAGTYEPTRVVALNHGLLHAAGCTWHDCLSFDLNRLDAATRTRASELARDILMDEFSDAPAFAIKDPRLCLTLPVWLPVFQAAGVAVTVLLVVRHPEEVAQSISRRDQIPPVASTPVWLHYMLEAERATRELPRAVISYDELLDDWSGCMAQAGQIAGIEWPAGTGGDRPGIDAFLDRSFRHHSAARTSAVPGSPPIPGLIAMTWLALQKLREDQSSPFATEWLDQAHATFASWRAASQRPERVWDAAAS